VNRPYDPIFLWTHENAPVIRALFSARTHSPIDPLSAFEPDTDLVRLIVDELADNGTVELPGVGTLSNRMQPARAGGNESGIKVSAPRPKLAFSPHDSPKREE